MSLSIDIIPILSDNYAYLLHDSAGRAAIVDAGEAKPILERAKAKTLQIESILCTHHHWDHTDGNTDIIKATGAALYAPESETNRIAGVTHPLREGDIIDVLGARFEIFETPCHTRGHICFYSADLGVLFTGDTLFSMGCGRFFEGDAHDMFAAFNKIRALPDDTLIYCGHEYTLSNSAFAAHIEPDNEAIQKRAKEVQTLRSTGKPSVPVTLGLEKATNPFLRADSADKLAELRALKDRF